MRGPAAIRRHARREDGQVLPLVALSMVVLLLFVGLVIDIGRVYVAQRQLQAAVDGAALAAGQDLPNATSAYSAAVSYSAVGGKNKMTGYGVSAANPQVTFECLSHGLDYTAGSPPTCASDTSNTNCDPTGAQAPQPSGVTTCNAVSVQETATVKTTFAGLSLPSISVSASSIAAAGGGAEHPLNVYVILDNTDSMTDDCSSTVTGISGTPEKIDCAKAGMRALLQTLQPCSSTLTTCGSTTANTGSLGANVTSNPYDEVGLLVFPAMSSTSSASDEINCTKNTKFDVTYPTWTPYTYSSSAPNGGIPASDEQPGYQAIGLSSDYRSSDSTTTLNSTTSDIVEAVDWGQCTGGTYPGGDYYGLKVIGGQGSYLAGAITEAQYLLTQNSRPGVTNAIVVESDGELNDPKTFTDDNPCASAINAATQAKAAGTQIYAIAYDSSGDCPDVSDNDTAEGTMEAIASNSDTFFYDPSPGDLTATFEQVGTDLTDPRLIPSCTAAPPGC